MLAAVMLGHCLLPTNTAPLVNPANTGLLPNAVSMLGQRRRRWASIETVSGQRPVFAGNGSCLLGYHGLASPTQHAGGRQVQRRRRWANIIPTYF